jgi:Tfp pilus assembly pilus retraction ATPase PilT
MAVGDNKPGAQPSAERIERLRAPLMAAGDLPQIAMLARNSLGASDIILRAGDKPLYIIKGRNVLVPLGMDLGIRVKDILADVSEHVEKSEARYLSELYRENLQVDFSIDLPDASLARVHVYETDNSTPAVAIRVQQLEPPNLEDLFFGSPDARTRIILDNLNEAFSIGNGLNAIGGPVRSGKTTFVHATYRHINNTPTDEPHHIVMVADPPEYRHRPNYAAMQTQTIGRSAKNYDIAVEGSLRIPHTILDAGEFRGGPATAASLLNTALLGSQVNLTSHTYTVSQTQNRFTGMFLPGQQEHMKGVFKDAIRSLWNLRLVPTRTGEETLIVQYINFQRLPKMKSDLDQPQSIEGGLDTKDHDAARSIEKDLAEMANAGVIYPHVAERYAIDKERFRKACRVTS